MSKLTVLFCGATGRLGGLTGLLTERGHRVLAATRHPASQAADRLRAAGTRVVRADFDDLASLVAAAGRADAVVAAGTAHAAGPAGDVRQGRNIIDAAMTAGVAHLVFLSVAGADRPTGVPILDSKHEVEGYLRGSGVPHTIVAPAYFMENAWNPPNARALAAGRWPSPVTRSRVLQQIPVADLLAFTVEVLESREAVLGERIEVASDELTADEAAAIISRLVGRRIDAAEPPAGQANPLFSWLERAGTAVDVLALRRRYPDLRWHSFAEWAALQNLEQRMPDRPRPARRLSGCGRAKSLGASSHGDRRDPHSPR